MNLTGRTIKEVRPLSKKIIQQSGWNPRTSAVEIVLDDGTILYPSCDEEGNDAGALFGINPKGEDFALYITRQKAA